MTRLLIAASALTVCIAMSAQIFAAGPESGAALQATNYIRTLQGDDGGFPDFGDTSTASGTIEAILAFAASGIDARTVQKSGNGPDDYLATQAPAYVATAGSAAKLVNGLAAMDVDPTSFGGVDALGAMEANYNAATGKYGDDVFAQSLFMLAEGALGRPVPPGAVTYLTSLQQADGGWEYCCGFGTDTNTTAIAVRALRAGGVPAGGPALVSAATFLRANQTSDGGFRYAAPYDADASSTAYVIQAILALGQGVDGGGPWDLGGGAHPLAKLLSFQNSATGAMQAFGADNTFATYQSVPGLMLAAFPEQAHPDAFTPTATATKTATTTATATATQTRTATATRTPTGTATATRSSTPTVGAPTTAATIASPRVDAVLGATARPTQVGVVSHLPSTGTGPANRRSGVVLHSLAATALLLFAAGAVTVCRRRAG